MPGPIARGDCVFCGREFSKIGLSRHLPTCAQRLTAQAEAERGAQPRQTLYHLLVQDAWSGSYFLHLEIRGTATLLDLDDYLRAIWLKCCGHLSAFEIEGISYDSYDSEPGSFAWRESHLMKDAKVNEIFRPGLEMHYRYDFGTTSELKIKVVAQREGRPLTQHPILLMARNKFEPVPCMVCGALATWLCTACLYDRADNRCEFCDTHADEHEHEEMLLALVNSPRVGMCGYSGPAEPPY